MGVVLEGSSGELTFRLTRVPFNDEEPDGLHEYGVEVEMEGGVHLFGGSLVHVNYVTDDPQRLMAIFDNLMAGEADGFAEYVKSHSKRATREFRKREEPVHA